VTGLLPAERPAPVQRSRLLAPAANSPDARTNAPFLYFIFVSESLGESAIAIASAQTPAGPNATGQPAPTWAASRLICIEGSEDLRHASAASEPATRPSLARAVTGGYSACMQSNCRVLGRGLPSEHTPAGPQTARVAPTWAMSRPNCRRGRGRTRVGLQQSRCDALACMQSMCSAFCGLDSGRHKLLTGPTAPLAPTWAASRPNAQATTRSLPRQRCIRSSHSAKSDSGSQRHKRPRA
jgi:hypothetical protein